MTSPTMPFEYIVEVQGARGPPRPEPNAFRLHSIYLLYLLKTPEIRHEITTNQFCMIEIESIKKSRHPSESP